MPRYPRRLHHHFAPVFHPYTGFDFHQHPGALFLDWSPRGLKKTNLMFGAGSREEDSISRVVPSLVNSQAALFESEDRNEIIIHMEVPGVQVRDITIKEQQGELQISAVRYRTNTNDTHKKTNNDVLNVYQSLQYLNPSKVNFEKLSATVKDGVLTIRIPKKMAATPLQIEVEVGTPPPTEPIEIQRGPEVHETVAISGSDGNKMDEEDHDKPSQLVPEPTEDDSKRSQNSSDNDFRMSIDMPGVKGSDLKLRYDDGEIHIDAKRTTLGGQTVSIVHRRSVPTSVDMGRAHAYLYQGVLTLVASNADNEHSASGHESDVRSFHAKLEEDVADSVMAPLVESLKVSSAQDDPVQSTGSNDPSSS